jgi:hypothetical protein
MEEHMFDLRPRLLILAFLLTLAVPAFAEDKCNVKAVLGGKPVTMKYCAVALYDSENSVTLYFSDSPFTAKEIETFQQEFPKMEDEDAAGKRRTMMHFAFCPGGGKPVMNLSTVTLVEMSVQVASSSLLGFQDTFQLPKDKDIVKIEKLSGDLKLGGKLAGRITGGRMGDGLKYSWEADFDMRLPKMSSRGGQGCGK